MDGPQSLYRIGYALGFVKDRPDWLVHSALPQLTIAHYFSAFSITKNEAHIFLLQSHGIFRHIYDQIKQTNIRSDAMTIQ
ncbi:hypothetical protein CF140_19210 [Aeromonas sobria]|nr:hypothetical protein CF140_19210 [Aeromonas sobria]